jgi:hypothetical protein
MARRLFADGVPPVPDLMVRYEEETETLKIVEKRRAGDGAR